MKKSLPTAIEPSERTKQLDELVLEIEFMLISIIQGVALVSLAASAAVLVDRGPMANLWYIAGGLLLILVFWSQSIIHALSFIRWPLDLTHTFLYFLATLIEVVTFGQILNPEKWFACNVAFFVVVAALYLVDLNLIKREQTRLPQELHHHIMSDQKFGLYVFVPLGLLYNLAAWYSIGLYPQFHLWFAIALVPIGLFALLFSIKSFKVRAKLLG